MKPNRSSLTLLAALFLAPSLAHAQTTEDHKLLPTDGATEDHFGYSVAISGNRAIVGAVGDDDNGSSSGSAYVFDVTTGQELAKLTASDGAAGDNFGWSVGISGDRAIVGAWVDDDNGTDSGSAYVFEFPGLWGWDQSPLNGHWYCALDTALTWAQAEAQAQAWGGHLTTVRNHAENDWLLANYASDGSLYWIGYHDSVVEGQFEWSSGETPGYENWRAGEPDDLNGADWAVISPVTGTWLDETFLPERLGIVEVISDDCDGNGLPDAFEIAVAPWLDWNGDGVLDSCATSNYCSTNPNSSGLVAVIGASGSPVVTENTFTLEAWALPVNEFGYFLASESVAFVPNFGGSDGNLCVGAPQYRFNNPSDGGQVLNSGATGTMSFTLNLDGLPQGISFDPGETWYFQLWFRDFTTGPTSNTTDGIEVLFR